MSPLTTKYYRGLEELETSPEIQQLLATQFPEIAGLPSNHLDRRRFLRLLGASAALAGVTATGCRRWPLEEIRPHSARPEGVLPGVPQFYATSFELDGVSTGILAKSYDGRPIKIEGNPEHPFSLGATDSMMQASLLELYDPERSRRLIQRVAATAETATAATDGAIPTASIKINTSKEPGKNRVVERTWADFERFAANHFRELKSRQGAGLAILLPPSSSPTLERIKRELETAMPQARWFTFHSIHRDFEFAGSRLAFNRNLRPQYVLEKASVIAAFDADLLGMHPAKLRLARHWAAGRHSVAEGRMNRMHCVESGYSITGSAADRRLALSPTGVARSLAYVAARLGFLDYTPEVDGFTQQQLEWLDGLVADLNGARGASVVVAGPGQPAEVHQLVFAINEALANFGNTIHFIDEPLAPTVGCLDSIQQLSNLLNGNVIQTLVILGGNPVFDAPANAKLNLASTPERPLTTIHLSHYENETSQQCTWNLPAAHFLECWGDGRAWDGTYSIQQPLILPLFEGKSASELLSVIAGSSARGQAQVRSTFDQQFPSAGQRGWEKALHDGLVKDSQSPLVLPPKVTYNRGLKFAAASGMEARFVPDNKVYDGRFANNAWLQELPDPLTKLTWDNAGLLSKVDADRLGIRHGEIIRIESDGQTQPIEIAAFIMPGHATGCVTLPLGYGRASGSIGSGVGFATSPLRTVEQSYRVSEVRLIRTGKSYPLATTQIHHLLPSIADFALQHRLGEKGQPGLIVHESSLDQFQRDHHAPHGHSHAVHPAPLFDQPHSFDSPHCWGMTIDLNACIGCSGCVVACQAENNIPVVGKTNVAVTREMHWLRIDRYFKGSLDDPDVVHVPITCAHCENAPCEQVCPVAATVHDTEGLNAMVYNRCIGTRYCANNCPLKVRRFNYLEYHATHPRGPAQPWLGIPDEQQKSEVSPLVQLMHNPDVTVRMRGVMEKCTFCIQRISAARIDARNQHAAGGRESNLVADGEIQTACQASCPTQAIRFGDLNDPNSAVSQARQDVRHYEILEELNLGSRTTHLAKIRNR